VTRNLPTPIVIKAKDFHYRSMNARRANRVVRSEGRKQSFSEGTSWSCPVSSRPKIAAAPNTGDL